MKKLKIEAAQVRGFNYHPSYSTGSMEDWLLFDREVWKRELANGKEKFPKMNTIRIWLSWNAYCRMGNRFVEAVREVFEICRELDLYVIPCLFNRWHDSKVDCDGIYIDHFFPESSWLLKYGDPFTDYIDALAEAFKTEERILVWDVCNEPFAYNSAAFEIREIVQKYELAWLHRMADRLRAGGVTQPLGIGSIGRVPMETFGDICDVYLTHLYYVGGDIGPYEAKVKRFALEAQQHDKPLICSECCWGSLDDEQRGVLIRRSLEVLCKYGVGIVAHALQYCGCADLHDPCDGRVSPEIGNLCFIRKDGSMRKFHDVYNEF